MNVILPIGSVVKIRDLNDPIMIYGYLQEAGAKPNLIVDYIGVPHPVGNIGIQTQVGFQMTDITEVLFEGYRTEGFKPIEQLLLLRQNYHKAMAEA